MSNTLGSVTLNDYVSWTNRYNAPLVEGDELTTLGGGTIVNRSPSTGTSDIILEAIEEDNVRKGYFTPGQLADICAYRDSGEVITLSYRSENIKVVVRANGVSVKRTLWQTEGTAYERYVGTITLKRA